ncbi:hypothetical protein [uncultured Oscillibacter sp.]|uniref:hypothetical protein n=1 Tax=uncultured Oscillibacter sp. TaxID=876091 RepID=UPI0026321B4F|nr:hypothetical protein [uncultured Oscillibacter sp.]
MADLLAGQKKKAEHKGAGKQQLRVLALKAKTCRHALCGLEHHIAQQQRPARRQDDG